MLVYTGDLLMQEQSLEQRLILLEAEFQDYLDNFAEPPDLCINCYHHELDCTCRMLPSMAPMNIAIARLTSQLNFREVM